MLKYIFVGLLTILILSQVSLEKNFVYPFKLETMPMEKYALLDLTGIMLGTRRLSADIAWIQLLQYYGTPEEHDEDHDCDHGCHHGPGYGGGEYHNFLKLCQRIVRLDPYFYYAYLYGSACLAWNLKREDEGLTLLEEGINNENIKNNPDYWQLNLYKAAIIYKKEKKYAKMVQSLQKATEQPDCPSMVKAILANIYKKNGQYESALILWQEILQSNDISYHEYAKKQITELRSIHK